MPSITVNGEPRTIEGETTLYALLEGMDLLERPVVCEINLTIQSKKDWDRIFLREGDAVEIIGFVGGGCADPGD